MSENEREDWITVVVQLVRLTQTGALDWKPQAPYIVPLKNQGRALEKVTEAYTTQHKGQKLRLYCKVMSDSATGLFNQLRLNQLQQSPSAAIRSLAGKAPSLQQRVILEFVDDQNNSQWTFPQMDVLNDLLAAIKYRESNADIEAYKNAVLEEARAA